MALGRLVIHAQVTTLLMFRSTPRKLQVTYGYVKQTIDIHWIQSSYYLSDMLSKHWDLFKILPMITNLLMTCGPTTLFPRSACMETPMLSQYMCYLPHCTQVSIIYAHTHKIVLHISTYYTCQHKSMPHPPQEGSNRSSAYWTLLHVLW